MRKSDQNIETNSNGIYYFLGNITSHALHLVPLHKKLAGTAVVLSEKAKKEIEKQFGIPVICLQDSPYTTLEIESRHSKTFSFLENNAKQIIFYEIFKFKDRSLVPKKPVTFFLTHGNMLKNYMNDQTNRSESVKDYDYIAGLGPFMKSKFIKESGIPKEKILDIGVARTDDILNVQYLKNRKASTFKKLKNYGLKEDNAVVAYMPTYWGNSSVYNTGLKIAARIKKHHFLIIRPHPQTKPIIMLAYKLLSTIKRNVVFAPHGNKTDISLEDIYATSDAIIGDVSSVMLESILLKKPLLFAYGSGIHRQDPSSYEAIKQIVSYSYRINRSNAKDVSSVVSKALNKGVDEKTWDETIKETFFLCGGECTEEIVRLVKTSKKQ